MRFDAGVLAAAIVLMGGSIAAGTRIQLPDPKAGQINGKPAVMYWPSLKGDKELLSPQGCTVHLVPAEDESRELIYPCGVWFQPPPDRYRTWMEKDDLISSSPTPLTWYGKKFVERGLLGVGPLVPAGKLALAKDARIESTEEIHLLSIDSRGGDGVRRVFTRRVVAEQHNPVAMPSGRVVAGVFKPDGDIVALSRPVVVGSGRVVEFSPTKPSRGTDVLAVLERGDSRLPPAVEDPELTLDSEGVRRRPDVTVRAVERIYAVWYAVGGHHATLRAASRDYALSPQTIALRSQGAVQFRGSLHAAPKVTVEVLGPKEAFDNQLKVTVRSVSIGNLLREPVLVTRPEPFVISGLGAEENVLLTLECGAWKFDREADLRSGDVSITFELKPYVVSGFVYYGSEPAQAEVRYSVGSEWVRSNTDTDGRYSVVLWKSGMYPAEVLVRGGSTTPFLEAVTIAGDDVVDFHVPKNRYTARVTNEDSQPVAGAEVFALNTWRDSQAIEHRVTLQAITNSSGDADLPPLRDGEASVFVKADGYQSPSPTVVSVSADGSAVVPVKLRRIGEAAFVTVSLPDGAPAAGAEVWALRSAAEQTPSWTGKSGEDGVIEIPTSAAASILLIRHSRAASTVVPCPSQGENGEARLEPLGQRVTIIAKDVAGTTIPSAPVAVWICGVRLTGAALAFITFTPPYTDASGMWFGEHLPAAPFRVLAWTRLVRYSQVASGSYDGVATRVAYPWPPSTVALAVE